MDNKNDTKLQELNTLGEIFDNILMQKLRKIDYLDEVEQDSRAVICNFGYVDEQIEHRDFSSTKK